MLSVLLPAGTRGRCCRRAAQHACFPRARDPPGPGHCRGANIRGRHPCRPCMEWSQPRALAPCQVTLRFSTLLHHCNELDAIQGLRGLTALQLLYLSGISALPTDVKQVLETPALKMLHTGLSFNATSSPPVFRPYETCRSAAYEWSRVRQCAQLLCNLTQLTRLSLEGVCLVESAQWESSEFCSDLCLLTNLRSLSLSSFKILDQGDPSSTTFPHGKHKPSLGTD